MLGRVAMRRLANSPWLILLVAMMVLLPPYVSTGFNVSEILQINSYILTHSIKHDYAVVFPLFNIIALLVLCGVYLAGQRVNRFFFSVYLHCIFSQRVAAERIYLRTIRTCHLYFNPFLDSSCGGCMDPRVLNSRK